MKLQPKYLSAVISGLTRSRSVYSASLLCVAATGLLAQPTAVSAQESQNLSMLEEVVVTARRREESIQDVPIAVTAMSDEFLRTQSIGQIEDLGTKVPSLRISGAGASVNEPLISLRGQRPAEPAFNQDQAVAMYFNDIVLAPTQGSNLGMYDLQNLQVLKGPQGTLFGRNSTGGAILLTPKRPGDELGGYMEVKVGDYNLAGFEGAVDIPVNDNLQMRLAAHKLDRDGYQKNVANNALNGDRYGDEHSEGVRLSINYSTERLNNLTVLALDENRIAAAVPFANVINTSAGLGWAAGAGYLPEYTAGVRRNIANDDPWEIETDVDSEEYVQNVFAANTTEFEINDNLSVKSILGYRKVTFETATDVDGTAFAGWGTPTSSTSRVTADPTPTVLESEFFSGELQLLGTALDDHLEWIGGVYWSETDATQDYKVQQAPGSYDNGISTAINTSYGVFGETTYHFTEQWSVTAGARQSWDEREMSVSKWSDLDRTRCTVRGPGGSALSTCERNVDADFDAPTWRVSGNFTPEVGVLHYASMSTGYRAGGFNTRGNSDLTLQPFEEENVTTYEIGHKADWDLAGMPLRTNTAIYFQDYTDLHQTRSLYENSLLVTRTENAGKAEITGFEVEATLLPTDNLKLNVSYSYVDAKFVEKTDLLGGVEVDTSDNAFAYIPEHSATASATYTLPVDASVGEMSLMASAYWQDEMTTHPLVKQFGLLPARMGGYWSDADVRAMQDYSKEDSYAIWNARFDWRGVMGSSFDVAAYINNATNEQYVLGGLNVVDSGGYGAATYGAPRTIGASVRYSF